MLDDGMEIDYIAVYDKAFDSLPNWQEDIPDPKI